jgi:tetratricopeptide (TPR) repeat protein
MVKLAPYLPAGWIQRSYALHKLKRTQEASDELLPAVDLFPREWLIRYNLACYACRLGNENIALAHLWRAFELGDAKKVKLMALDDPDLEPFWAEIGEM